MDRQFCKTAKKKGKHETGRVVHAHPEGQHETMDSVIFSNDDVPRVSFHAPPYCPGLPVFLSGTKASSSIATKLSDQRSTLRLHRDSKEFHSWALIERFTNSIHLGIV